MQNAIHDLKQESFSSFVLETLHDGGLKPPMKWIT